MLVSEKFDEEELWEENITVCPQCKEPIYYTTQGEYNDEN